MFKSFGYYLELDDKKIYYSGDSGEFNLDVDILDEIYHDCSSYDIKDFPHIGLETLSSKIEMKDRHKVYLMHFGSLELISKAREKGFSIVELSNTEDVFCGRGTIKLKSAKIRRVGRKNIIIK